MYFKYKFFFIPQMFAFLIHIRYSDECLVFFSVYNNKTSLAFL